ncbi:hypothetical protein [Candidatus Spongiihabitans sp.]|uniref:hypothetical protein n=1 Tax=Candidatus Spongiihabitans sp. TaxID=3101308 RepID=UPI003C6F83B4
MNWQHILKKFWAKKSHKSTLRITAVEYGANQQDSAKQNTIKSTRGTEGATPRKAKIKACLTQFADIPDGARKVRVIIGIDFGTAFTKVVIEVKEYKYGVPLNDTKQGTEKYLLPTRMYQDASGNLTVTEPKNLASSHTEYTDLKMRILDNTLDKETRNRIITYIAWVLQKSRGWLMNEKQAVFGATRLKWEVNVGLPTEKYEDEELRKTYRELVGEAWYMSTDPQLRGESDGKSNNTERKLHPDHIEAFPEFVAQIQSYISSPQRKRGIHTLVDVGAGTIDATVFIVHQEKGENIHPILAASVESLGTIYLANHRCSSLMPSSDWTPSSQDLFPSLDEFTEKLGVTLEQINVVDKGFRKRVIDQINSRLKHAKPKAPIQTDWETGVPLMLCGGGARVEFYKEVVSILIRPEYGYLLQKSRLSVRDKLDAPGLLEEDSDRLSVAYGLSFDALQIGEITHPGPIPFETENTGQGKSCPKCSGTGGGYSNCPECGGSGFR